MNVNWTLSLLKDLGGSDHLKAKTDVSSMDSVKDTLKQIQSQYSHPPDVVVNCAGITMDKYFLRMPEATFDKVIEVNLKGIEN